MAAQDRLISWAEVQRFLDFKVTLPFTVNYRMLFADFLHDSSVRTMYLYWNGCWSHGGKKLTQTLT